MLNNYEKIKICPAHLIVTKHYAKQLIQSMAFHGKPTHESRITVGILGEVVLAQLLGTLKNWRQHKELTKNNSWDGGYDLMYNNYKIDCKTLQFRNPSAIPNLNLFKKSHNLADIFVQILIDENILLPERGIHCIDNVPIVWCAGWTYLNNFNQNKVLIKNLYPIKDLINYDNCG
jgi:hypothetical protein